VEEVRPELPLEVSGRDLDDSRNLAGRVDARPHRPLDRLPIDAVDDHLVGGAESGGVHRWAMGDLILDLNGSEESTFRPFSPFQKEIYPLGSF